MKAKTSFEELWFHARDRLGLLPQGIDLNQSGSTQVREILQSSWSIARMANEVRNVEGTGHGRTLPTAMSADLAMLVVRELRELVGGGVVAEQEARNVHHMLQTDDLHNLGGPPW